GLAQPHALFGPAMAGGFLDRIELGDAPDGFCGHGGSEEDFSNALFATLADWNDQLKPHEALLRELAP
ncbi:MAG: hypothetical protein AAGI03_13830, partial [Pseudomonadota bacterium]